MKTLPSPLRCLRLRRNLGLRELARAMSISAPYLMDLELGRRRFTPLMRARHRAALKLLKPNVRLRSVKRITLNHKGCWFGCFGPKPVIRFDNEVQARQWLAAPDAQP